MIGDALDVARGDVVLCGLPALILRYISPTILDGTGYSTVEELSVSPDFSRIVLPLLAAFKKRRPHVRIVLVSRNGAIIARSP